MRVYIIIIIVIYIHADDCIVLLYIFILLSIELFCPERQSLRCILWFPADLLEGHTTTATMLYKCVRGLRRNCFHAKKLIAF